MFGQMDKGMLYVILGVLVLMSIGNLQNGGLEHILLILPGIIIAITFHEFAHAYAADKLGDTTPRNQGRLTLNPLTHLDPVGTIVLIFAHVGWGKPVQINPNNFTSNKSRQTCEAWVSLAGPLMNFFIAFIGTIIFVAVAKYVPDASNMTMLMYFMQITIVVNIGLRSF